MLSTCVRSSRATLRQSTSLKKTIPLGTRLPEAISANNSCFSSLSETPPASLITGNVHSTAKTNTAVWRNKPLFRRQGDVRFKTGLEAADLLRGEAMRRDAADTTFIAAVTDNLKCLAPVFDRNPKYAFVAKTLLEPERMVTFRVSWMDDAGVIRMNRGYRIQYCSSIGSYTGSLQFGSHVSGNTMKAIGYDMVFSNALTNQGAAVGGSDLVPHNKSDGELQRFCQSYMTELGKYLGQDSPTMGPGVGKTEMGYLYGQYKRIHGTKANFLTGDFPEATGYGIAHFAAAMLKDNGDSLEGKRCLIVGSGKTARSLADKLLAAGAIPVSFSDASGYIYEPAGFSAAQLRTLHTIKSDRGALVGRYIISSTTSEFVAKSEETNGNIFEKIQCDLCFPCEGTLNASQVQKLADAGCRGVLEGSSHIATADARKALKKRGMLFGPAQLTLTGSAICQQLGSDATDEKLQDQVNSIYKDVKETASEFNARGDLLAGTNILGFLKVANVMMTHGAV